MFGILIGIFVSTRWQYLLLIPLNLCNCGKDINRHLLAVKQLCSTLHNGVGMHGCNRNTEDNVYGAVVAIVCPVHRMKDSAS